MWGVLDYCKFFNDDKIKKILDLSDDIIPLSLIHVGYMDEEKEAHSGFDNKRVFYI